MKRRDVLKAGILTTAGFALPTIALPARTDGGGRSELRVALIGVGTQGRELIRATLLDKTIRFVAVCDIWEYARRYGQNYLKNYGHDVAVYADHREMLEKETQLDAVIIASPDYVHATQAADCLQAGRHVYCETPMSHSLDGARSMVRAARDTGKLLQIGYQRRSNPRYLHAAEKLLQEARLTGRTTHVESSWMLAMKADRGWPRRHDISGKNLKQHGYAGMEQLRNWRWFRPFSGGLFPNLGCHQVDVACWFLKATPRGVMANGGAAPDDANQWTGDVTAIYNLDTSAGTVPMSCRVLTSTRGDGTVSHENFLGTEGSIHMSQNPKHTAVYRDPDTPEWDDWVRRGYLTEDKEKHSQPAEHGKNEVAPSDEVVPYGIPVVFDTPPCYPHLANFFASIRGESPLTCPAETAFVSEVAAHGVSQALQAGGRIAFKEEDFTI